MTQKSTYQNSTLTLSAGDQFHSHIYGGIIDILEPNGFKAPFDCTLLKKESDAGNTFVFQSKEAVQIPSLTSPQFISFRCTHMNNKNLFNVGQEFSQGTVCYYQGTAGAADGDHIHLQFALGKLVALSPGKPEETYLTSLTSSAPWGSTYRKINTNYNGNNVLLPWDALYLNDTVTIRMHDGDLDYKADYLWTLLNGAQKNARGLTISNGNTIYARISAYGVHLREGASKTAKSKIFAPIGSYVRIDSILNVLDSDGFTWAYAYYGGMYGYMQLDTNFYILSGKNTTLVNLSMYLKSSGATLRNCPRGESLGVIAPVGSTLKVIEFLGYTCADNFRWVKVQYGTQRGYIQYDPTVMYVKSI